MVQFREFESDVIKSSILAISKTGPHLLKKIFIRMMSGSKLEGLAATDLTHRGNFSTKDSLINFVVPGDKPSHDLRQECSKPGILFST